MSRDPTGLTDVRVALSGEMDRRWNAVRRIARRALAPIASTKETGPMRPDVSAPPDIRGWLTDHLVHRVGGRDGRWLYPHLETAASRATARVGRLVGGGLLPPGPAPSLPTCHLASATYLAGICADTATEAHSAVAEGLLRRPGRGPSVRAVDRALLRGKARSRVLAEHAITQAHAQATLDALRAAGVERVGSISEHRVHAGTSMYQDANLEAAGILFVDPDGNGLFLHRTDGAGWALPGGGIEGPETPEVAAVREGHEEVGGVPIGELKHLTTRTRNGVTFHTFRHDVQARFTPQLNHEHDDWTWAPLGEPPSPLHPGVAWTLRQMQSPSRPTSLTASVDADGGSPSEDHDHDVPELACMSRDGLTFYWDRHLPTYTLISGEEAHVPALLKAHETAELEIVEDLQRAFVEELGREPNDAERVAIYEEAHHRGGLVAEKAEADRQGIDWRKWNDWCGAKYEEIKSIPVTNPVPDPHVRPAPHDRGDYEETLDADPYWRSAHSGKFVTKAHHATLDPDEEWEGPDEGDFNVETAEDDRVCQVCEDISDNGPYTIDEARDLIPAHLHCRCVFVPAET
jgi:8-oxo-dGTP pyrophosphatase MutT (NUDIX family)